MKIHFLGTNGWFDSDTGETPSILIDAKEAYVILDAGNSLRKIDRHITDPSKPIYLLLSHFHLDHIFGLHILPKFAFPQGMTILGQPGTKGVLSRFLAPPFTAPMEMLCSKMRLDVADLEEGMNTIRAGTAYGPIKVEVRYLIHKDPCVGYSLMLEGKKITYCTDTGVCDNLIALAKDADLLISECAWKRRNQSPDWPHLAPEDAAESAQKADAKRLILTHLDAGQYRSQKDRMEAQERARKIFKKTLVAKDDFEFEL
jgi:ribonuclease BN (tRNA processing enzyme)